MTTRRDKIEELVEGFHALRRNMVHRTPHSAHAHAITPAQWIALMEIHQHGESSVKEVARALNITSSATTQLVDSLVESGYVVRKTNPEDRRTVSLTLSKKTAQNIRKMKAASVQKFQKMFSVLTERELEQYCALSKKIIQGMHKK